MNRKQINRIETYRIERVPVKNQREKEREKQTDREIGDAAFLLLKSKDILFVILFFFLFLLKYVNKVCP